MTCQYKLLTIVNVQLSQGVDHKELGNLVSMSQPADVLFKTKQLANLFFLGLTMCI